MAPPRPAPLPPSAAADTLAACASHLELLARLLSRQKDGALAAGPSFHLLLERSSAALSAELGDDARPTAALCPPAALEEGELATTADGGSRPPVPLGQNDSALCAKRGVDVDAIDVLSPPTTPKELEGVDQLGGADPQARWCAKAAESDEGSKGGDGVPVEELERRNSDGQTSGAGKREMRQSVKSNSTSPVARINSIEIEDSGWHTDSLVLSALRRSDSHMSNFREMDLAARSWAAGEGVPHALLFLCRVVRRPTWELFWSALVALNCLSMVLEEEFQGIRQGHELGVYEHYGSDEWKDTWWPGCPEIFEYFDWVFTVFFAIELSLVVAHDFCLLYLAPPSLMRMPFWRSPWEILDLVIVIISIVSLLGNRSHSIDQSARFLRVFRLFRILRLVRLMRLVGRLDTLHVMTTALTASLPALFYTVLLLCVIMSLFAMALCKVLRFNLEQDSGLDEATRTQLFRYFGTYTRAMLSMSDLTLSNWTPICRFIFEEVHEFYAVVVVLYKLSVGFAFIGVINGVFIQETFTVAQHDEHILVRRHMRQKAESKENLERLFRLSDQDGDGMVSQDELHYLLEKNAIRNWLEANGLKFGSSDVLFKMIAGDQQSINVHDFISGLTQLRGPARNIDLVALTKELKEERLLQPE